MDYGSSRIAYFLRHRSSLAADEGTQKQEMAAQVQQASANVEALRAVAHNLSRDVKTAEATLQQVWFGLVWFVCLIVRLCCRCSCCL